jgi:hypothetical protein
MARRENSTEPGESERTRTERELARERALERRERSQLQRVGRALRLADFIAILMVAATAFAAYAAWRTAEVTSLVFAISERPFLGIQQVAFEAPDSPRPRVAVEYRNFGKIPAVDSLFSVHLLVDGKLVKQQDGQLSAVETGIVSPTVPHFFYAFLPADAYHNVISGKDTMQVHVRMIYKGPARQNQYCYSERIVYDYRSASFRLGGGSDHCGQSEVF